MPDDLSATTGRADADVFRQIAGAEAVTVDLSRRALLSQDIWAAGESVAELVVAPAETSVLAAVVAAAAARGFAIAIRGGGMSYTRGYVPGAGRTLLLDLSRMDRVLEVRPEDMTVTVQAGCTWKTLHEALAPLGLRTPFWGPLSGITSTVGGGLSQQNAFFGSGHYGTTSESLVSLAVVLADGEVLRTGALGQGHPFYRFFGPDLAGLFCGDSGVFGVKAEITLRLIRAPAHEAYASFSFKARNGAVAALAEIARAGVASETCGFDPGLAEVRMRRASLVSDVKTLGNVIAKQKSLLGGLKEAAKIAAAGRGFIGAGDWSVHLVCEGRSEAAVAADLAGVRRIALEAGGREIENTIPKVLRAQPFTPLNNVLGPGGERWVPIHGIVALSEAAACYAGIEGVLDDMRPRLQAAGVSTGFMLTTLSTNGFLIEPVFFWPEERQALHEATVEPQVLARLDRHAANPEATALVSEARSRVIEVFAGFGAAHFQVGRTYPYMDSRDGASRRLLQALKDAADPERRFNPGGLGL